MGLIRRELAAFAFFAALAMALTWPLAAHLDTAVSDAGDPLLNAFILDWDNYSLTHAPLHLYAAPILHPGKYALAYSENMLGIAVPMLPLYLAGVPPIAIHNIAMLLGFALSAYAAYVLARMITGSTTAALVAGVLYGFVPFKWDHLSHLQIVSSEWLPLMLAALLFYRRQPSRWRAALFAAAFVMNGLTNVYWLLFGSVAIFASIVFLRLYDKRLFVVLAMAALILLPFLIPYQLVKHEYGMSRRSSESLQGSATPIDWFAASGRSALYGGLVTGHDERRVFPGVLLLVLPLLALVIPSVSEGPGRVERAERATRPPRSLATLGMTRGAALRHPLDYPIVVLILIAAVVTFVPHLPFRGADVPLMLAFICALIRFGPFLRAQIERSPFTLEQWTAALWIPIGLLGSLGEHTFFHSFLFRVITPFRATRVPARWAMIAYAGLAVWAAIGAARIRKPWRIALIALAVVDVFPIIHWTHYTPPDFTLYRWIAATRPRAIVELPMVGRFGLESQYVYAETIHHMPNFSGTSGFEPPLHRQLWPMQYQDGFVELLAQNGCELVVVHEEELGADGERAREWVMKNGCLVLVRRFGTDAVYSITCGNRQRASRISSSTSATSAN